jgi:hypothetical protein
MGLYYGWALEGRLSWLGLSCVQRETYAVSGEMKGHRRDKAAIRGEWRMGKIKWGGPFLTVDRRTHRPFRAAIRSMGC